MTKRGVSETWGQSPGAAERRAAAATSASRWSQEELPGPSL